MGHASCGGVAANSWQCNDMNWKCMVSLKWGREGNWLPPHSKLLFYWPLGRHRNVSKNLKGAKSTILFFLILAHCGRHPPVCDSQIKPGRRIFFVFCDEIIPHSSLTRLRLASAPRRDPIIKTYSADQVRRPCNLTGITTCAPPG